MNDFDLSTLTWRDAADVALQRTRHLISLPRIGPPSYRAWRSDLPHLLYFEAALRRKSILTAALEEAQQEFGVINSYLGDREINRSVDIGCGHALIDLFIYRQWGCHIHLVDIEWTEARHHEWRDSGSGYASLAGAKRFLAANGVPPAAVQTTNPRVSPLHDEDCELVLSLLSAGFHYPVGEYAEFAFRSLKPGGVFIFDARKGQGQEDALQKFHAVEVVQEERKHRRLAAVR